MKNLNYFSFLFLLIFACNSSNKKITQNFDIESQDFLKGKEIYTDFCMQCHMDNGEGIPKIFPPLAKSDYLKNNRIKSIKAIKYGLAEEITVNGEIYKTVMASQGLTDQEIADVMNYITNSWGNENTSLITEEEVSKIER
ncbi:MAG: cytochrome c [Lacinutrix sp.]|uniref:c-type cytochrome n=1 Tax=Lacinutrix sp. TaxID=1937692 RepID=UPI0030AAEC30